MTDAKVKMLREALETAERVLCERGLGTRTITAALAATAESAKRERPHEAVLHSRPEPFSASEPSPAPRDAEREALLAFGEKVLTLCSQRSPVHLPVYSADLAALLSVRK